MNAETENKIRTSEAEYVMKLARKNGSTAIYQTIIGNVEVEYNDGIYTVTKMLTIEDYLRDENSTPEILATGKKSEVIETIKKVFEIIED